MLADPVHDVEENEKWAELDCDAHLIDLLQCDSVRLESIALLKFRKPAEVVYMLSFILSSVFNANIVNKDSADDLDHNM